MGRAMDQIVVRSMAKWPDVPDVYGWLSLDRRGNWLIKDEKIGNVALREFIARNYQPDAQGRWFFQNGPQRVFVKLAYTPLIVRHEGDALLDHCGRHFHPEMFFLDEEGSVLVLGRAGIALLDDRDLGWYADRADTFARIGSCEVPRRFVFVADPAP